MAGFEGDEAHRNGKIVTLVDYLRREEEWRVQGLDPDDPKPLFL